MLLLRYIHRKRRIDLYTYPAIANACEGEATCRPGLGMEIYLAVCFYSANLGDNHREGKQGASCAAITVCNPYASGKIEK
jgi:hypothetical protein